jgi:hypothetical protein
VKTKSASYPVPCGIFVSLTVKYARLKFLFILSWVSQSQDRSPYVVNHETCTRPCKISSLLLSHTAHWGNISGTVSGSISDTPPGYQISSCSGYCLLISSVHVTVPSSHKYWFNHFICHLISCPLFPVAPFYFLFIAPNTVRCTFNVILRQASRVLYPNWCWVLPVDGIVKYH